MEIIIPKETEYEKAVTTLGEVLKKGNLTVIPRSENDRRLRVVGRRSGREVQLTSLQKRRIQNRVPGVRFHKEGG